MRELTGTVFGRWYVTLFGITFAVLCLRHLGWRRTGVYTIVALAIGALAENGSVHLGIPYTRYAFDESLRGKELFIGDVPLMVTLSYTFMSYFAFAGARLVVAGPRRTRSASPVLEYLVAVMLAVWALWIVDPVSRLGAHFFLGELFHYEGPGFWFGLPLGSQLGFALTAAVLVGLLTYLGRDEPDRAIASPLRHPRLPALAGYVGQVLLMTGAAFAVARLDGNAVVVRQADALAGATFVLAVPMVLLTAVHWRSSAR
ncbi:MAG: carotenoid biosynthesis protein [Acidimicrobiia bacterium]